MALRNLITFRWGVSAGFELGLGLIVDFLFWSKMRTDRIKGHVKYMISVMKKMHGSRSKFSVVLSRALTWLVYCAPRTGRYKNRCPASVVLWSRASGEIEGFYRAANNIYLKSGRTKESPAKTETWLCQRPSDRSPKRNEVIKLGVLSHIPLNTEYRKSS